MNAKRKSLLQIAALIIFSGTAPLAAYFYTQTGYSDFIATAKLGVGSIAGYVATAWQSGEINATAATGLGLIALVAFLVHTWGMVINAIKHGKVGWALALFMFGPLASFIYFFAEYEVPPE